MGDTTGTGVGQTAAAGTRTREARACAAASADSKPVAADHSAPRDVRLEVLYRGVCHSDLHQARDEWASAMPTVDSCLPGHEIVGRVTEEGNAVRGFREGASLR